MLVTDIMNKLFEILKVSNKVAIKLNFRLVTNSVKFTLLGKHVIEKKNYSWTPTNKRKALQIFRNSSKSLCHRWAARTIFNSPKDMRSSDVPEHTKWHPLSYCYKLALLKLMHKAFYSRLPQVLSDAIAIKHALGHSLRAHDSLTVPRFNTNYGKTPSLIKAQCCGMLLLPRTGTSRIRTIRTWQRKSARSIFSRS